MDSRRIARERHDASLAFVLDSLDADERSCTPDDFVLFQPRLGRLVDGCQ